MKNNKGIAIPVVMFILLGVTLSIGSILAQLDTNIKLVNTIADKNKIENQEDWGFAKIKQSIDSYRGNVENMTFNGYREFMPNSSINIDDENLWLSAASLGTDENQNTYKTIVYRMCYQSVEEDIPFVMDKKHCAIKDIDDIGNKEIFFKILVQVKNKNDNAVVIKEHTYNARI